MDPARQALPPRITCYCPRSCSLSRMVRLYAPPALAQPSYTPFPLYPPLSPSGPTVTQAPLFLKGKGGGGEREGETTSLGLGV